MNLMNAIMLSCVNAAELIEQKQSVPIGLVRNVQLKMHVAMCPDCRNYLQQSLLIDKWIQELSNDGLPLIQSTDELQQTIIKKIEEI